MTYAAHGKIPSVLQCQMYYKRWIIFCQLLFFEKLIYIQNRNAAQKNGKNVAVTGKKGFLCILPFVYKKEGIFGKVKKSWNLTEKAT